MENDSGLGESLKNDMMKRFEKEFHDSLHGWIDKFVNQFEAQFSEWMHAMMNQIFLILGAVFDSPFA